MKHKNRNIIEIKTIEEFNEFKTRFFNDVKKISFEQWLNICLRFEEDEDNINDSMRKVTQIKSKMRRLVSEKGEKWVKRLESIRGMDEQQKGYFLTLPETVYHDGNSYPLRNTAYHATVSSIHSFILMYDNIPAKNKLSILIPCLRPFYGYVSLPSLDFSEKVKAAKKSVSENIKFRETKFEDDLVFHIAFPKNYFIYQQKHPEWDPFPPRSYNRKFTTHVTWNFDRFVDLECLFGGTSEDKCATCGNSLSHLIALPSIKGVPYTGLEKLTIATCMKCVGWVGEPISYHHDTGGKPLPIPFEGEFEGDDGNEGVIKPATVYLSKTLPKYYKQNWGRSDDQNLNRIGGTPSWVQGKERYKCPKCNKPMDFLMQLDSDLPTVDGQRWLWGSGGVLFVFWCDDCKVDSQMWQCT